MMRVGIFGASAFIAGCAGIQLSGDRVNPEVPLWYHRPADVMHVFIHRELTAAGKTVGEDNERGRAEIDPIHDRVFVGSSDHGLYALRAKSGGSIWRFETLGIVQSEPYYDSDLDEVFFGSDDGALYALRAATGDLVWRYNTGAEVARRPVALGETLFFANAADQLFAVDRRTGKTRWQVHRTPALGMEVSGYAGPAVSGSLVYMAYSDGHVIAYDANDGTEKWTPVDLSAEADHDVGGEAPRYLDVDTTPVVDTLPSGRVVYVASYAAGVFALDASTGSRVWANDRAVGVTDLVLWEEPAHRSRSDAGYWLPERKLLLATGSTSGLWALDPITGRMMWRVPLPEGGITTPVPIAGALLVGTSRYGLFLLSPLNGRPIDGIDLGTGFAQVPAAWGRRAYALSNAGTLLGLEISAP